MREIKKEDEVWSHNVGKYGKVLEKDTAERSEKPISLIEYADGLKGWELDRNLTRINKEG